MDVTALVEMMSLTQEDSISLQEASGRLILEMKAYVPSPFDYLFDLSEKIE